MTGRDRRRAALEAYLHRPSASNLDRLRATIERELVDRVALFSEQPAEIARAVDAAFAAFANVARSGTRVNWLTWLSATAMSVACGRREGACWFDDFTARFPGTLVERRALVLGVILTLDGRCQWAFLRRTLQRRVVGPALADRCRRNLLERLDLAAT
jgi:hypothetical protein